ncbi:uncharacterized protein LOC115886174 [Sitophilus oryzae]|uniref:Uncharacterized protein LOC115886174 n=1 Tax=Sitophilus oryzae TaxID=7048 RepID=A0A6J2YCQ7_SITOR|nr:uncharacterized protein LOC115886174 [Sitophilus oryzae]
MMMCWAPDCKHYNVREKCNFFKFPKEGKERNKWKKLTRRTIEPGPGAYLCSCHFREGNKEDGPELFLYNRTKKIIWTTPEKVSRKRKNVSEDVLHLDLNMPSTSGLSPNVFEESETNNNKICKNLNLACEETEIIARQVKFHPATSGSTSSAMLEAENDLLRKENDELKLRIQILSIRFSFDHIKDNEELVLLYTGLPNSDIFMALLIYLRTLR